jgi:hypothetical protein
MDWEGETQYQKQDYHGGECWNREQEISVRNCNVFQGWNWQSDWGNPEEEKWVGEEFQWVVSSKIENCRAVQGRKQMIIFIKIWE